MGHRREKRRGNDPRRRVGSNDAGAVLGPWYVGCLAGLRRAVGSDVVSMTTDRSFQRDRMSPGSSRIICSPRETPEDDMPTLPGLAEFQRGSNP